jgi:hypothetical protein
MKVKWLGLLLIPLLLSACLGNIQELIILPAETVTEMAPALEPEVIEEESYEAEQQQAAVEFKIEETIISEKEILEMTSEDFAAREKIGLAETEIRRMIEEQRGRYHFDRLNADEQRLYVELLKIMEKYGSDIIISTVDPVNLEKVFQCVLNDQPQIFYVVGYRFTKFSLAEVTKKISFTASYSIGIDETKSRQVRIDAYVYACLSGMPAGADDYEKSKYIYEYLINNTEYHAMSVDNQNICSVFLNGFSVCQGYAKATQYLLNEVGIPATLMMGKVHGGEGHAWVIALLDGEYYHIDTTFGDASYQSDENASQFGSANDWSSKKWPISYDYLNVTTEQIEKTHKIEPIVPLVNCTSIANNYYIREGLYITEVDGDKLRSLFNREYARGSQYVTLKCASSQVFAEMMDFLIEQQNIFVYLHNNDGMVTFVEDAEQLSIGFWL